MMASNRFITYVRVFFIITVVGFFASLAYVIVSVVNQSQQTYHASQPVAYNAYFVHQSSPTTMRYYNGNTFLSYDTSSHTTTPLTTIDLPFGELGAVYWLRDGVVFNQSTINPWNPHYRAMQDIITAEQLAARAAEESDDVAVSPDNVYWYLSFANNSIKPISQYHFQDRAAFTPTEDGGLVFHEGDVYSYLAPDGNIRHDLFKLDQPKDIHAANRILYVSNTEVYYLYPGPSGIRLNKLDRVSGTNSTVIPKVFQAEGTSILSPAYMTEPGHLVIVDGGVGSVTGQVISISLTNPVQRTLLVDNFSGTVSQNTSSLTAIHTGATRLYVTLIEQGAIRRQILLYDALSRPQNLLCATTCWYSEADGILRAVAQNDQDFQGLAYAPHDPLEKQNFAADISITRQVASFRDNQYDVTYLTGQSAARYRGLITTLRQGKLDPYAYTFVMNPGRWVEDE